jgi:HEAT repeat protein
MARWWPFGRTPEAEEEEPVSLPTDPADWVLGERGLQREQVLSLLVQELASQLPSRRERAVELLAESSADEAIPEILALLRREKHLMIRGKALQAFRQLAGDPGGDVEGPSADEMAAWQEEVVSGLMEQLTDKRASQRWGAAEGLGRLGDPKAVPPLVGLLRDPHAFVRWAAAQALGQVGGETPIPLLLPLLEDPDRLVRRSAVDALGHFNTPAVCKALRRALHDRDPTVRRNAVEAVARLNDTGAIEALTVSLDPENDLWLRYSAAEALGTVGDHRAIPPLIEAARDPHVLLRRAVVRALGLLGDSRAINALVQALEDKDPQVRLHAADGLGRIGHEGNVAHLKRRVNDRGSVFGRKVGQAAHDAIELIRSRAQPEA